MKKSKDRYQRCFLLPGNKIKHYESDDRKGVFDFNDTLNHTIKINTIDFKNNNSTFELICKSAIATSDLKIANTKDLFLHHKTNLFKKEDVMVEIPLHCLYQDVVIKYAKTAGSSKLLSDVHHILNEETPVHHAYALSIKPRVKALKEKDKLLIVSIDDEGHVSSEGGTYENGFVVSKPRNFGNFAVMMDTTAPSIKLLNFNKENSTFKQNEIKLKITDDLSGIKSYKGSIDDVWVLMVYDNKEKTLTYTFDEKLIKTEGEHIFMAIIVDKKGNTKKLTLKFKY